MSCPQNGDRIVTIDTARSLHPMHLLNADSADILISYTGFPECSGEQIPGGANIPDTFVC